MKRYRLNRAKFSEFLLGLGTIGALAALLVWVAYTWIMTA